MNSFALVTVAISGFGHAVGTGSERAGQRSARAHRVGQSSPARSISYCPMPSWILCKERVLTVAGVEAAQATLSAHHQRTVGLLHSPSNYQPKKENK